MKKRIQRNLCIFVATMLLLSLVSVSATAAETSINPIPDKTPGSNVTITGTSVYDRVSIKVIKPDGTIYDVDSVQTMGGNYNYNFTLPEEITGVYTVVAGIAPIIVIMFILKMGTMMNVEFEKVLLLYNPSIYETADVISTFVYRRGLIDFQYGYSTAVGLFNSVVNFFLLIATNTISRKVNETSLW